MFSCFSPFHLPPTSVSGAEGTPLFEFVYRASYGKISEVVFDIQEPEDTVTQTTTSWDFSNDLAHCGDGFLAFTHFSDITAVGFRACLPYLCGHFLYAVTGSLGQLQE